MYTKHFRARNLLWVKFCSNRHAHNCSCHKHQHQHRFCERQRKQAKAEQTQSNQKTGSEKPIKKTSEQRPTEKKSVVDTTTASVSDKQVSQVSTISQNNKMSINKRAIYARNLDNAHKAAHDIIFTNWSIFEVEDHLTMLEQDWEAFKKEHEKVIEATVDPAELENQAKEYDKAQQAYKPTRSLCRTRIAVLTPKQQIIQHQPAERIKLEMPHAEIPNTWGTFSGGYTAWKSFRDCFKVIHEDENSAPSRKCHYLSEALKGEAAGARGELGITEQTYQLIWQRLEERYEDDYKIVEELVGKLLSMPKLTQPSCSGLRRILDVMRDALGQLKDYFDITQWDPLLVFLVLSLIDNDTRGEWEKNRSKPQKKSQPNEQAPDQAAGTDQMAIDSEQQPSKRKSYLPSWADLEKFIEQQAKYIAHLDERHGARSHNRNTGPSRERSKSSNPAQQQPNTGQRNQLRNQRTPCLLCNGPHPIFKCEIWLKEMNLAGRIQYMNEHNLCHMCLRPNHNDFLCYTNPDGTPKEAVPCPRCPNRKFHNSTLCPSHEADKRTMALNAQQSNVQHGTAQQNIAPLGNVQANTGAYSKNKRSA